MSMNIQIEATRTICFKDRNNKKRSDIQHVYFEAWQTPTAITNKIMDQKNNKEKIKAYKEYFKNHTSHIIELDEWINEKEIDGYSIEFFAI